MNYIEVGFKEGKIDPLGNAVKADIKEDLLIQGIESVSVVEIFRIDAELSEEELTELGRKVFADPITQDYSVNKPLRSDFDWEITVTLHKDVTDNVGIVAVEAIKDFLGKELDKEEGVRTAKKYLLKGKPSEEEVKKICSGLLANEVIESFSYRKRK